MTIDSTALKRWLSWFVLVAIFATACGFLANWQFNRREEKLAIINQVNANYDADAVPIEGLLPSSDSWNESFQWRPVSLTGHYLPEASLLVRNRPNNGAPGFEQLVPFESNGVVLFVSRGWLPTGNLQDSPDQNPLPSNQLKTIVVRLRASEPHLDREAPKGQTVDFEVSRVAKQLGISEYYSKAYGRLKSESPSENSLALPASPIREEGNNLSYAIQWIVFALMAIGALFWAIRQERNRKLGIVKVKRKSADETFEDEATTER
jgi:cytochrome oxidase assembly protein ShyY1